MFTYNIYMTIDIDVNKPEEEKHEYLKDLANDTILKFIWEVIKKNNIDTSDMNTFELYIASIHTGSNGVGDGYVGGNYQAIDADDPAYIHFKMTMEYSDVVTIFDAIRNNKDFDFIDEMAIDRD